MSLRKHAHRSTQRPRSLELESLEQRYCLNSDFSFWFGPSISFAPDGVDIAGEPNELTETLDEAFPEQDWRSTILSGFQRWAIQTNMNARHADERGAHSFGAQGNRAFDSRFADVRIGARPLSSNIKAITIPRDSVLTGTWAGDVIFNSSASFDSLDELLAVALHEAGHAFGLPNSDEPDSAMNSAATELIVNPSSEDIQAIQELFGEQVPDEHEGPFRNDSIDQATIGQIENFEGAYYWSALAEVEQDDVDFYSVEVPDCCSGNWTLHISSLGTSLLVPEATVYDSEMNVLQHLEGTRLGDRLQTEFSFSDVGSQIYIRVASPRHDEFGTGSYVASMSWQVPTEPSEITFTHSDEPYVFVPPPEPDVRHIEESQFFNNAYSFAKTFSSDEPDRLDLFSFPTDFTDSTTAEVELLPIFAGVEFPQLEFKESNGEAIASTVLVNDWSGKIIQVPASKLTPQFLLRVTPSEGDALPPYLLNIRFHSNPQTLDPFVQGELTPTRPLSFHQFRVPVSQLSHFSFTLNGDEEGTGHAVITSANGKFMHSIEAKVGETKTLSGALLPPGEFDVVVYGAMSGTNNLSYSLTRTVVSDPFGVSLVEPNDLDFTCPNVAGVFCYPGGIESNQPGLWDDFLDDQPEPTAPVQPDDFLGNWWNWYWNTTSPDSNSPPLAVKEHYESNASHMLAIDKSSGVLANDVDPNSDYIWASIQREPSHGLLEFEGDGSFEYRPFPGFIGQDSFDYRVTDGEHQSRIATVTVDVTTPVMAGDFNADGRITANDIDTVAAAIREGTNILFDLDSSGVVDTADLAYMVQTIAGIQPGDFNLDGRIDAVDLNTVGKHWQQSSVSWSQGDSNGDGIVDALDLNTMAVNWARQSARHTRAPKAVLAHAVLPERSTNAHFQSTKIRRLSTSPSHLEKLAETSDLQLVDIAIRSWQPKSASVL